MGEGGGVKRRQDNSVSQLFLLGDRVITAMGVGVASSPFSSSCFSSFSSSSSTFFLLPVAVGLVDR